MTARLPDPAGVGPRSWTVGQAPEGAMGSLSRTGVLSGGGRGQGPHTPQGGRQRTLDCGRTARSPGSPPRVPVTRGPAGRGGGGAGGAGTHALCSSTRVGCGADGTKGHPEPQPAGQRAPRAVTWTRGQALGLRKGAPRDSGPRPRTPVRELQQSRCYRTGASSRSQRAAPRACSGRAGAGRLGEGPGLRWTLRFTGEAEAPRRGPGPRSEVSVRSPCLDLRKVVRPPGPPGRSSEPGRRSLSPVGKGRASET